MFYSHQQLAGKAPLAQICESSRMTTTLHAKINGKKLDNLDIIQICEEILNPSVGLVIVDEIKLKHLFEDLIRLLVDVNGACRTKAVPDLTLLSKGRAHARLAAINRKKLLDKLDIIQIWWGLRLFGGVYKRKVKHLFDDGDDVTGLLVDINGAWRTKAIPDLTLLPKGRTHARNFEHNRDLPLSLAKKWQHKEKHRASSGSEGGNIGSTWNSMGCSSKRGVDKKGRLMDEEGFTYVRGHLAHIKPREAPPPGVVLTNVEVFLDLETLKFRCPADVYLLPQQLANVLDDVDSGNEKIKYRVWHTHAFVINEEHKSVETARLLAAVDSITKTKVEYVQRRLICRACKADPRNHPAGVKTLLLELHMIFRIAAHAMTLGAGGALMIVSNDPYLYQTLAQRLMDQYTNIKVLTPAPLLTCLVPQPMYRSRQLDDVRPRNRFQNL